MLVVLSLLVGIGLGVGLHPVVPPSWAPYLPMAVYYRMRARLLERLQLRHPAVPPDGQRNAAPTRMAAPAVPAS